MLPRRARVFALTLAPALVARAATALAYPPCGGPPGEPRQANCPWDAPAPASDFWQEFSRFLGIDDSSLAACGVVVGLVLCVAFFVAIVSLLIPSRVSTDAGIARREGHVFMTAALWALLIVCLLESPHEKLGAALGVVAAALAAGAIAMAVRQTTLLRSVRSALENLRGGDTARAFVGMVGRVDGGPSLDLGAQGVVPLSLGDATLVGFARERDVAGPCVVLGDEQESVVLGYRDAALRTSLRATLVARGTLAEAAHEVQLACWNTYARAVGTLWSVTLSLLVADFLFLRGP